MASWPLEALQKADTLLPPLWDGDVDINDAAVESALLTLQHSDSPHALYMAVSSLYSAPRNPQLALKAFAVVRGRAGDVTSPRLSLRIELAHASMFADIVEHARALVIRQRALGAALAVGDNQLVLFVLLSLAASCVDVGEAELELTFPDQLQPLLPADDVLNVNLLSGNTLKTLKTIERLLRSSRVSCVYESEVRHAFHVVGELMVLLTNAVEHAPKNTQVTLRLVALRSVASAGETVLSISHRGQGPAPPLRAQLHQPSLGTDVFCANPLELARATKVCRLHRMRLRFDGAQGRVSRLRVMTKNALHAGAAPPAAATARPQEARA